MREREREREGRREREREGEGRREGGRGRERERERIGERDKQTEKDFKYANCLLAQYPVTQSSSNSTKPPHPPTQEQ